MLRAKYEWGNILRTPPAAEGVLLDRYGRSMGTGQNLRQP